MASLTTRRPTNGWERAAALVGDARTTTRFGRHQLAFSRRPQHKYQIYSELPS